MENTDIPAEDCSNDLSQYVDNELDCDDSNVQTNPTAVEICDRLDNDCDGAVDEEGSGNQVWFKIQMEMVMEMCCRRFIRVNSHKGMC